MSKAIQCDRCGKFEAIPQPGLADNAPRWMWLKRMDDILMQTDGLSLCPNCATQFDKFMKEHAIAGISLAMRGEE